MYTQWNPAQVYGVYPVKGAKMNNNRTRAALSRSRVVRAAMELVDELGLEALSMRALAAKLGVVPMALYKHVQNREDLVTAMVDEVIMQYAEPPEHLDWRERVKFRVMTAHECVRRHPWLEAALTSRSRRTEAVLAHMDAISGDLIAGGASPDLAHYAMHALGNRIWGAACGSLPRERRADCE